MTSKRSPSPSGSDSSGHNDEWSEVDTRNLPPNVSLDPENPNNFLLPFRSVEPHRPGAVRYLPRRPRSPPPVTRVVQNFPEPSVSFNPAPYLPRRFNPDEPHTSASDGAFGIRNVFPRLAKTRQDCGSWMVCAREKTENWLEKNVYKFNRDFLEKMISMNSVTPNLSNRIEVHIQIPDSDRTPHQILTRLERQNPGLTTTNWQVVTRVSAERNQTLTVVIDPETYEYLRMREFALAWKSGSIPVKLWEPEESFEGDKRQTS